MYIYIYIYIYNPHTNAYTQVNPKDTMWMKEPKKAMNTALLQVRTEP